MMTKRSKPHADVDEIDTTNITGTLVRILFDQNTCTESTLHPTIVQ